jgi:hypothetical protein
VASTARSSCIVNRRIIVEALRLPFDNEERTMVKAARISITAILFAVILGVWSGVAQAAVWGSSDQWATWSNGGYTLYNDVWGSGHGPQSIWANSYSNWGVWSNQPNTGGVKSYPNVTKYVGKSLSSLGSAKSSFNVSLPAAGAYEAAYDIWDTSNAYETMLWMDKYGAVGPIGSYQTAVAVGGHSWNVYKGSNGSNQVFSFVRTSNTASGTVDIKAILNWIKGKGWFGNITLGNVQFGFEITSCSGGYNFISNSYSVTTS